MDQHLKGGVWSMNDSGGYTRKWSLLTMLAAAMQTGMGKVCGLKIAASVT